MKNKSTVVCTVTNVPASVPGMLITITANAASRSAAATHVPRTVDRPCSVIDGTTDRARLRNRQAKLKEDIKTLEE